MAKRGAWADHVVVINMAKMLEHDIMIVTSSPSTSGNDCLVWVTGDRSGKKEPLLLGHLWENHYQSLQPIKPIVSSLTEKQFEQFEDSPFTRKKDGQFKDSPLTGKQECDGYSEDWLRDKIGSYFHIPLHLRRLSVNTWQYRNSLLPSRKCIKYNMVNESQQQKPCSRTKQLVEFKRVSDFHCCPYKLI